VCKYDQWNHFLGFPKLFSPCIFWLAFFGIKYVIHHILEKPCTEWKLLMHSNQNYAVQRDYLNL
jgi:hypothetical protein